MKLINKLLSTNIYGEIDFLELQGGLGREVYLDQNKESNPDDNKVISEDRDSLTPIRLGDSSPLRSIDPPESIEQIIEISSISIENNKSLLTELKTNKPCVNCSRNSIYTDNVNNYCWIHSQM